MVNFVCQKCGSKRLKGREAIKDGAPVGIVAVTINDGTRKGKNRKETLKYTHKPSFFAAMGRWHNVEWTFDRRTGRYVALITDRETGEVIKHKDGRPSKHQVHGTAKMTKPDETGNVTVVITDTIGVSTHVKGTVLIDRTVVGYSESLHDGRAAQASLGADGITHGFAGKTPKNETGTMETCGYLIEAMNQGGTMWNRPTPSEEVDTDAICTRSDGGTEVLRIQVVRAQADPTFWKTAHVNDGTVVNTTAVELVNELQVPIKLKADKIPRERRLRLVLALSAIHTPGYVVGNVAEEFQKAHGEWVASLGFQEIWLVGPGAQLTHRLA